MASRAALCCRRHMANNSKARSNLANMFMVKQLRLSAPASQKLEEEARE